MKHQILAGLILLSSAAAAQTVVGTEVYRRSLPAGSRVRVYQGTTLLGEHAATGDTRVTVQLGTTPTPTPVVAELETLAVPAQVPSGGQAQGTVTLSGPGPQTVALLSSSGSLSVPATVPVPAGVRTAVFPVTAASVTSETAATVTASLRAVTRTAGVRVMPKGEPQPEPDPNPQPVPAEGWFVSPTGTASGDGTRERPWDIATATNGTKKAITAGGGTVWLMGGTYRLEPRENREGLGYRVTTSGTAARPLVYRAVPGQRVVIDGGLSLFGTSYVWIQDIDITVTDLVPGKPPFGESGSWPGGSPNGGLNVYQSVGCKGINLRLFRNRQGASLWTEAKDFELYGCSIWDNGWVGSDRAHGHSVYSQAPPTTTRLIEDCIITATDYSRGWRDGRYTMHGYGERVAVANHTVRGWFQYGVRDAFLLDDGAPAGANAGHKVLDSVIYGVRVRLGSRPDQPLELRNTIITGELQIGSGSEVTRVGNLVVPPDRRPTNDEVRLRVNKHDPARAHVMLLDWSGNRTVTLADSGWLGVGDRVRVLDPTDQWGTPLWAGAYPASGVEVPVPDGARAVILLKETAPGVAPAEPVREEAPVTRALRARR